MPVAAVTGTAALAVGRGGGCTLEPDPAPRVRGASAVKPLLCWAGVALEPLAGDRAAWKALARPSITASDNDATAELWSRVGEQPLLAWLNERAGLSWCTDGDGEHPSLRVMVTAGELARAYAALAEDASDDAVQVRGWMRAVRPEQTFGLREVAVEALGVDRVSIGIKCGWFGGERAHAVVLVEDDMTVVGSVVTTHRPPDADRAEAQRASGDDRKLVALHDDLFGETIRSATRRTLLVAASL